MRGVVDRSDKFLVRGALLAGLAGGTLGFIICVVIFACGVGYGLMPLHPIMHKLVITLEVFVVSFLVTLGIVLQQAYWS